MKKGILNLAVNEALKSTYKQRLGSVIFDKKRIVSTGHNYSLRSAKNLHPKYQKWEGSIHAEVDTILNARRSLVGLSILTVRLGGNGDLRLAKPCLMCQEYLYHVGIKKIYYSTNEGIVEELQKNG